MRGGRTADCACFVVEQKEKKHANRFFFGNLVRKGRFDDESPGEKKQAHHTNDEGPSGRKRELFSTDHGAIRGPERRT